MAGVVMEVAGRRDAGLRFEVASGDRLLLRQQGSIVLFAQVHPLRYGVDLYRTGAYQSPLPAVPADLVRRFATAEPWHDRWAYQFATWLDAADGGPLHDGAWLLEQRDLPPYCLTTDLVLDFPAAYLDWLGQGWNGVVPLRDLPPNDSARVKAYRKQARDNVLPPLLLWEATALDGYILLDGHARLAAARAEQVRPDALVLTKAATQDPIAHHRTTAWLLTGGSAAWDQSVEREAPDWPRKR